MGLADWPTPSILPTTSTATHPGPYTEPAPSEPTYRKPLPHQSFPDVPPSEIAVDLVALAKSIFKAAAKKRWNIEAEPGKTFRDYIIQSFAAEFAKVRKDALEEAAQMCDQEATEYRESSQACRNAGNAHGESADFGAAVTASHLAKAIRVLSQPGPSGQKE
jgi:hypothetical protein